MAERERHTHKHMPQQLSTPQNETLPNPIQAPLGAPPPNTHNTHIYTHHELLHHLLVLFLEHRVRRVLLRQQHVIAVEIVQRHVRVVERKPAAGQAGNGWMREQRPYLAAGQGCGPSCSNRTARCQTHSVGMLRVTQPKEHTQCPCPCCMGHLKMRKLLVVSAPKVTRGSLLTS